MYSMAGVVEFCTLSKESSFLLKIKTTT